MIDNGIYNTMSKHDQETQHIPVIQNKNDLETVKITIAPIKNEMLSKSQQETQRISPSDSSNQISLTLTPQELRNLPFGTIKLDNHGKVLRYNPFSAAAGPSPESIQGKNFFYEVILFEAVAGFAGKYSNAVKAKELYAEFKFHITSEGSKPIDMQITLYYSKNSDSFWALINRASAEQR
jgi:photoactive yellow protein